jgi:hypothetical protein
MRLLYWQDKASEKLAAEISELPPTKGLIEGNNPNFAPESDLQQG